MNDKKKETMLEDISEHIADHDMRNHHYLTDSEIIEHFKSVGIQNGITGTQPLGLLNGKNANTAERVMSENNEKNIVENLRVFNEVQKTKALVNTHKTYWKDTPLRELLEGLDREVIELKESIKDGKIANTQLECADVANYAAMIFDKIRNGS